MSSEKAELESNFTAFTTSWQEQLPKAISALDPHREAFLQSYSKIAILNAWKTDVLETTASSGSVDFYLEALNDALVSHVFARCGSWRVALMSLRSCIENTLHCLFYMDHPVELKLWQENKHRLCFSELYGYLERHPALEAFRDNDIIGLPMIKSEYATLSRAVHASASSFRMTAEASKVSLWKPVAANVGQWHTREQHTILGLNLLLVGMFKESLQGTQQLALRRSMALVVPASMHSKIKASLHVTIPSA